MTPSVIVAFCAFALAVPLAFATRARRHAAVCAVIAGTLFLPIAVVSVAGAPDLDKLGLIGLALLLGIIGFGLKDCVGLRCSFLDCWLIAFAVATAASVMTNEMGAVFASSSVFRVFVSICVPYMAGRIYVRTARDVKAVILAITVGGVCYLPLCWIEMRLSPQLHTWVYGYHQHSWAQASRGTGWRPTVFMQHGLMVGIWMSAASIAAIGLCLGGQRRIGGVHAWIIVGCLVGTVAFLRSLNAIVLLAAGVALLVLSRATFQVAAAVASSVPVVYIVSRVVLRWDGAELIKYVELVNPVRAESLGFRLGQEELLIDRAMMRPWLGWGGYGHNRMVHEGDTEAVTDSLWIVYLGLRGAIGVVCYYATLLLAPIHAAYVARKVPADLSWMLLSLTTIVWISVMDSMFNATPNQVFYFVVGGLVSVSQDQLAKTQMTSKSG